MYAKTLVEDLINDTITHALSDDNTKKSALATTVDHEEEKANEETDVSLSLATEEPDRVDEADANLGSLNANEKAASTRTASIRSPSTSHVETDSLDESEHAGQHS